jgi:uncharacterized membrane protein
MQTQIWSIGLVIIAAFFGGIGPIFMKRASSKIALSNILRNKDLFLGLFFYGIATILFVPSLKGGELSVLYPFVATSYIWVSLLSTKMLGENMSVQKWLGIIFILIGVTLVGIGV